jgi:hypothetical protein
MGDNATIAKSVEVLASVSMVVYVIAVEIVVDQVVCAKAKPVAYMTLWKGRVWIYKDCVKTVSEHSILIRHQGIC